MRTFDAVLFDFDGVLADTEPIHWKCWNEILKPFGIGMSWEMFERQGIGRSDQDLVAWLATQRNPPIPFEDLWAAYPKKKSLFRETVLNALPFEPATVGLLADLRFCYKLAVVSSSARLEVEPPLIEVGIRSYFAELICGTEAGQLKPAPDPYLRAAALLGAQRPLVVEDSEAGLASGRAAGFEVIQVRNVSDVAASVRRKLSGDA